MEIYRHLPTVLFLGIVATSRPWRQPLKQSVICSKCHVMMKILFYLKEIRLQGCWFKKIAIKLNDELKWTENEKK